MTPEEGGNGEVSGGETEPQNGSERRTVDSLVARLLDEVRHLSRSFETISGQLTGFTTTGDVNQKVSELEDRLNRRTLLAVLLAVLLSLVFAVAGYFLSAAITHDQIKRINDQRYAAIVSNCNTNNESHRLLRALVDRSATPQFDPSKLSPAAQEILAEFARAATTPSTDGKPQESFHDFAYRLTPIANCNAIKHP
jgi:hypothetical protein